MNANKYGYIDSSFQKYKLTDQNLQTYNGFEWVVGEEQQIPWHITDRKGTKLCSETVFHFYDSPEMAVLMNPAHASIENPRLFEAEIDGTAVHDGLKGGCKKMRLTRELTLPKITLDQKVEIGIRIALAGDRFRDSGIFEEWASRWLGGTDRSAASARAVTQYTSNNPVEHITKRLVVIAALQAAEALAELAELSPDSSFRTGYKGGEWLTSLINNTVAMAIERAAVKNEYGPLCNTEIGFRDIQRIVEDVIEPPEPAVIRYKLTDQNMRTYNNCLWFLEREKRIRAEGSLLCTNQVFHFYDSPEMAVLMNPAHAAFHSPRLFKAEVSKIVAHDGLKGGCKRMKLVEELPLPEITLEQRVEIGIKCVLALTVVPKFFEQWAEAWLGGDCSSDMADNAVELASFANDAMYPMIDPIFSLIYAAKKVALLKKAAEETAIPYTERLLGFLGGLVSAHRRAELEKVQADRRRVTELSISQDVSRVIISLLTNEWRSKASIGRVGAVVTEVLAESPIQRKRVDEKI